MRAALTLGRKHGYRYLFLWRPEIMARLCHAAFEHGVETEWAGELVRRNRLPPPADASGCPSWPWPIKIFTLGRFALLKDGQPLRFTRKSQRRPLDLLKALIAFGGREVAEQRVAEALWPEAEGDAAQQALTTTLFRLRKLVGHEVVRRQAAHLTLDPQICWVDCWACERLLGAQSNPDMELFNKIASLYHKPFLYHEQDAPWALPLRERLHAKLLGYTAGLGKALQETGQVEEAIAVYLRGLEIDDLYESFYCGLIKAYVSVGRACDAALVYRRCHKVLSARLGVEPSLETRRAYLNHPTGGR